jgi:hypothetical protein
MAQVACIAVGRGFPQTTGCCGYIPIGSDGRPVQDGCHIGCCDDAILVRLAW